MSEINLLHSDAVSGESSGGYIATIVSRVLLVLLIVAVIGYAFLYIYGWSTEKTLTNVKQQVQTLQSEALANTDRNELVTRQEQIIELETLISEHVYWSYLLPELARVTLRSAQYTDIEATKDGKLNLAVSLATYPDVEKYMQIFDLPEYNQQFSNVRILGIDTVQKEASIEILLRLQLNFNPEYIKGRM